MLVLPAPSSGGAGIGSPPRVTTSCAPAQAKPLATKLKFAPNDTVAGPASAGVGGGGGGGVVAVWSTGTDGFAAGCVVGGVDGLVVGSAVVDEAAADPAGFSTAAAGLPIWSGSDPRCCRRHRSARLSAQVRQGRPRS